MNPKAKHQGILSTDVGSDVVLYDETASKAHRLNRSAAFVWQRCDGETTVAELAAMLGQELGAPADENLVLLALADLQSAGLLVEQAESAVRIDRAAFLKKVAAVAAIAPVVYSIAAPTPAMAESGAPSDDCPPGSHWNTSHTLCVGDIQ